MFPSLPFHVVGVSHHTAGVEVRERLAFDASEASALLSAERLRGRSALLLSTCNRTELYWSGDHDLAGWFGELAALRGAELQSPPVRLSGGDAVRHLFRVAAGLDSQILGESEILGQVRRACEIARGAGTFGGDLEMVFGAAIAAGRRVRRETVLGRHPGSVGSAAVEVGLSLAGLGTPRVVVLGAGEVADGVLRALLDRGVRDLTLVSRNPDRAAVLAGARGVTVFPWEEVPAVLSGTDLLVVTTAANRPCVSAELLAASAGLRESGQLVVLDLAVPRNVDPAARGLERIRLLDLDDLQALCCPAGSEASSASVPEADQVLLEELVRLDLSLRGRAAGPRLAELHRMGAELAQREAAWALSRLDGLSERERQIVQEMAHRLVRRVLYPVSRSLRLDEAPGEPGETTQEPLSA